MQFDLQSSENPLPHERKLPSKRVQDATQVQELDSTESKYLYGADHFGLVRFHVFLGCVNVVLDQRVRHRGVLVVEVRGKHQFRVSVAMTLRGFLFAFLRLSAKGSIVK